MAPSLFKSTALICEPTPNPMALFSGLTAVFLMVGWPVCALRRTVTTTIDGKPLRTETAATPSPLGTCSHSPRRYTALKGSVCCRDAYYIAP